MSKTWFITGTSRGFGRNITELLLERGDRVAATLRTPSRLDDLAERYGDHLWVRALDVSDTAQIREVVDAAFDQLGRIDVVLSNAGYGLFGAAEELSDEQIERQLNTNVLGSIQLARAVIPHLREQGGGQLLQVSSLGGHVAFPGMSLYHASKWALEGFYEALAPELEPFGIRTTLIEPGAARTDFGPASADLAPAMEVYAGTPAAAFVRGDGIPLEAMPGDPRKMAEAMIRVADLEDPPRRQLLGSDAVAMASAALSARLEAIDEQREIALSTDADDYQPAAAGLQA